MNGLPEFGDLTGPVFNPLTYPRRALISALESYFSQDSISSSIGRYANRFQIIRDEAGETDKHSKLVIADSFSDELSKTDSRPTLIISRGSFQFLNMAIDSLRPQTLVKRLHNSSPGEIAIGDSGHTKTKHSDMTNVPIEIKCHARQAVEAEMLAWMTAGFIQVFNHQIRDGARLHKISSPSIGPIEVLKADSKPDLYRVSIVLTVQQTYVWDKHTTATANEILASSPPFSNVSNKPQPTVYGAEATVNTDTI